MMCHVLQAVLQSLCINCCSCPLEAVLVVFEHSSGHGLLHYSSVETLS
jgi:hypothetical protein